MSLPDRSTLAEVVAQVNAARRTTADARRAALAAAVTLLGGVPGRASLQELERCVDSALGRPSRRLAVYGSLRRGECNHGEIADLEGRWSTGCVRGHLDPAASSAGGWATLAPDACGEPCAVEVLESGALPGRWRRLDAFEGDAYRRELALVEGADGSLCVANLYAPARASG